jgi:DnaJ-class molecular chaperone
MKWKKETPPRSNSDTARKTQEAAVRFETCAPCNGTGFINGEIHGPCWGQGERKVR